MTRIEAFIPIETLFNIIAEVAHLHKAQLVFQRFETNENKAGFTVVDPLSTAFKEYLYGGYQLLYLSIKGGPKDLGDWDFLDREAPNLIEFAGARQAGGDLEQVVIRPMAKKSKAAKLFESIRSAVEAICHQGVILNGRPYPKIFYAKELQAKRWRLWVDLDTKTIEAKIGAQP